MIWILCPADSIKYPGVPGSSTNFCYVGQIASSLDSGHYQRGQLSIKGKKESRFSRKNTRKLIRGWVNFQLVNLTKVGQFSVGVDTALNAAE